MRACAQEDTAARPTLTPKRIYSKSFLGCPMIRASRPARLRLKTVECRTRNGIPFTEILRLRKNSSASTSSWSVLRPSRDTDSTSWGVLLPCSQDCNGQLDEGEETTAPALGRARSTTPRQLLLAQDRARETFHMPPHCRELSVGDIAPISLRHHLRSFLSLPSQPDRVKRLGTRFWHVAYLAGHRFRHYRTSCGLSRGTGMACIRAECHLPINNLPSWS